MLFSKKKRRILQDDVKSQIYTFEEVYRRQHKRKSLMERILSSDKIFHEEN